MLHELYSTVYYRLILPPLVWRFAMCQIHHHQHFSFHHWKAQIHSQYNYHKDFLIKFRFTHEFVEGGRLSTPARILYSCILCFGIFWVFMVNCFPVISMTLSSLPLLVSWFATCQIHQQLFSIHDWKAQTHLRFICYKEFRLSWNSDRDS